MGSFYSTYLKQKIEPDLIHIVVWAGDLIKESFSQQKNATVVVTIRGYAKSPKSKVSNLPGLVGKVLVGSVRVFCTI